MTESRTASLTDMLTAIKTLRNEVPEFNPDDAASKEKIESFHQTIHALIVSVKNEIGFETYEQTIKFIDMEIRNMGKIGLTV
jgi:hypothetical protein